jgi:outer membrane protein TolC
MLKRTLLGAVLMLAYASTPVADDDLAAAGAVVLTEAEAVQQALASNPGLHAMRARAEAFAAIPDQVASLPDPLLAFNLQNLPINSFSLGETQMTQVQLGVSQAFPYPGKLGLRGDSALLEADAEHLGINEMQLRLTQEVKSVWWQLLYLDRALTLTQHSQNLVRQLVSITQTKYKVGEGLQQDVLLAQLELSGLLDRELKLKGMRTNVRAQLNALLDRPMGSPILLPAEIESTLPRLISIERMSELVMENRPLLMAQQKHIEAAQKRLDLAQLGTRPDFHAGAVYGQRKNYDDFVSLQFSMSLPLYAGNKQDKLIDQRTSELLRQQYQLQDLRGRVFSVLEQAFTTFKQASEQLRLLEKGIIPQARQTVDSMMAGYQVNKVDFLNLVRTQIALYGHETRYWEMMKDAHLALAKLEATVGEELIYE